MIDAGLAAAAGIAFLAMVRRHDGQANTDPMPTRAQLAAEGSLLAIAVGCAFAAVARLTGIAA